MNSHKDNTVHNETMCSCCNKKDNKSNLIKINNVYYCRLCVKLNFFKCVICEKVKHNWELGRVRHGEKTCKCCEEKLSDPKIQNYIKYGIKK